LLPLPKYHKILFLSEPHNLIIVLKKIGCFFSVLSYNNSMVTRELTNTIKKYLFEGRCIVVFGPRRVGKTTLAKWFAKEYNAILFNCDRLETRNLFYEITLEGLKNIFSGHNFIIFDEVQELPNAGKLLKLIVDEFPNIQVFATGSCPFGLHSKIGEPLTGRKFEFYLMPFSFYEMVSARNLFEEKSSTDIRLIYGYYPEIVLKQHKEERLRELVNSYLLKDILLYSGIRNSEKILLLLKTLALQIGQLISYNEIAQSIGLSVNTVAHYIDILEKMFVIFKLNSFSRNLRTEMKKSKKIFFWDLGIRNAILNMFFPVNLRQDIGHIWENFIIAERKKQLLFQNIHPNHYFWRTNSGSEIDLVEELNGKIYAWQIKWNPRKKANFAPSFLSAYNPKTGIITKANFEDFLKPLHTS